VEGGREGGLKGRMGWWKQIIDGGGVNGGGVNLSQARVFSGGRTAAADRLHIPTLLCSTLPGVFDQ
jgi:hypothetical protein